jgi:pimeloyl-ACP methyl ester carboxylesterase
MLAKCSLVLAVLAWAVVGCAPPGPYRAGQGAIEYVVAEPSLCPELGAASRFKIPVAYLEIDEQGSFQDRGQLERALALVSDTTKPKYVVVFVHGWFHSAGPADENVRRFKCALTNLQGIQGNAGEDVIGVYVGWRGRSWTLPVLRYATFWERKNTSEEIGRGSLVEFLMRLERAVKPDPASLNKLMVVGHSFGASVVFNSIGQILLARFLLDAEKLASERTAPAHSQSKPGLVSGYGDLVVLVNPAIEATRIVPFFASLNDYTTRQVNLLSPSQPPRLVILSSEGDRATRMVFPAARVVSTLLESYEDRRVRTPHGKEIQLQARHLDWQTMGNADALQTHDPLKESTPAPWAGKCPAVDREWLSKAVEEKKAEQRRNGEPETGAGWSKVFEGAAITLRHRGITTPSNPLWIMAVGTRLIPDHSGVASPVMICLFDELLGDPAVVNPEGERHLDRLRRSR